MSKAFISLRDFLLLGNMDPDLDSEEYNTGVQWVQLYELAKKQWKQYGDSPPIPSFVTTIRSGFGVPIGSVKKIIGMERFGDSKYLVLGRANISQEDISYLIDVKTWCAYIAVTTDHKEPESIL